MIFVFVTMDENNVNNGEDMMRGKRGSALIMIMTPLMMARIKLMMMLMM